MCILLFCLCTESKLVASGSDSRRGKDGLVEPKISGRGWGRVYVSPYHGVQVAVVVVFGVLCKWVLS